MTPIEFAKKYDMAVAVEGEGNAREIAGVYCCDLLSMVMGRARENEALVTVMSNMNTLAVGVLADVSCVILCEGIRLDEACLARAKEQDLCVLYSEESSFFTSLKLAKELGL